MPHDINSSPAGANACLMLADGNVFFGKSLNVDGITIGEICFNTAMTGYQEVLTDPSYAGQIITFTFPHIGNVGCNDEDVEAQRPHVRGLVLREEITPPSNYRSGLSLTDWLKKWGIIGICGVDTRALTRHIRLHGAQNVAIISGQQPLTREQLVEAKHKLAAFPSLKGMELAKTVTTNSTYGWTDALWQHGAPAADRPPLAAAHHVVAIDYGIKHNILRNLVEAGCRVTVMPASAKAHEILALKPNGVFLSNGPGDPAATAAYAVPEIQILIEKNIPIFGICLGHQLLALAMGAKTEKMAQGHRGANHPVKELASGRVMITSQNHGFVVSKEELPQELEITHLSLFDGTIQGLRHKTKPAFCLQGHPEASPGPHDSQYLFDAFIEMMGPLKSRTA